MKRLSYAMLLAALLAGALSLRTAWAQDDDGPGPQDGPPAHEMQAAKLKDKLGLTDDQVTQLDAVMKAHMEAVKPLRRAMRDGMNKLRDQLEDKADDRAIQATLDKLHQNMKDMQAAEEKMRSDVQFLSATQRAKLLLGIMARRRAEGMGPMGRGKGGHPGMGSDDDDKGPRHGDRDGDDDGDGD